MPPEKIETRLTVLTKWPLLRRPVMGTRLIGRGRWSFTAEVSPELPAKRLPLFGRHAFPPLPHLMPFFGRQGSKPLPCVADGFTLFRWQIAKSLESFTKLLLLLRRHLPPFLKPLAGLLALVLAHVGPLTRSVQQALLPVCGDLIPAIVEPLENLLFLLVQLLPRNTLVFCLRPS